MSSKARECFSCKKYIPEGGFDFIPKLQGNFCTAICYSKFLEKIKTKPESND